MAHLKKFGGHLLRVGVATLGHLVRACGLACDDLTCTSYTDPTYGHTVYVSDGVDLGVCECRDFETGVIRVKDYTYTINITGTAVGSGRVMNVGGTPYALTDVDLTGSYSFSIAYSSPAPNICEFASTPTKYIVSDILLVNFGGVDYYARVEVRGTSIVSVRYSSATPSEAAKTTMDATNAFAEPCEDECLCKTFNIPGGGTYTSGSEGHDLSGLTFSGGQDP